MWDLALDIASVHDTIITIVVEQVSVYAKSTYDTQ